jgi:hypothetical protein
MSKEFTPYQEALALKELGFDEPCFGRWLIITEWEAPTGEIRLQLGAEAEDYDKNQCIAPLYQQAFRWFREKHKLDGFVQIEPLNEKYGYVTYDRKKGNYTESKRKYTLEEAELACLRKLIEIVKGGDK